MKTLILVRHAKSSWEEAGIDDFDRPWPNIIAADDATIASVDRKWSELGLGELIKSPSLKYKTQLYGGGASV